LSSRSGGAIFLALTPFPLPAVLLASRFAALLLLTAARIEASIRLPTECFSLLLMLPLVAAAGECAGWEVRSNWNL